MKCKFCFVEVDDDVTVCPVCGKALEETEETPVEETVEIPAEEEDKTAKLVLSSVISYYKKKYVKYAPSRKK